MKSSSDAQVFYLPQDPEILSVSADGTIKAKKGGTTTVFIIVPETSKYQASIKNIQITVSEPASPAKAKITKVVRKGSKAVITWEKQNSVQGWQLRYSLNKNMKPAKTIKVTSAAKTSKTLKGLKRNRTYYVQLRAYSGSQAGPWSAKAKVKAK